MRRNQEDGSPIGLSLSNGQLVFRMIKAGSLGGTFEIRVRTNQDSAKIILDLTNQKQLQLKARSSSTMNLPQKRKSKSKNGGSKDEWNY